MVSNPFLGVFFHWLGGLAAGSFYTPYRGVRKWSWEVYWLVGGFFSWVIAPWLLASLNTNGLLATLGEAPVDSILWSYFWGVMWGVGGLTFGLTMRYLGVSLGMAVALGYCAVFGTLIPPVFHGEFVSKVLQNASGQIVLLGVVVCIIGIAVAGLAGRRKERELSEDAKKATISEFNFTKGILVATFSGIMSASMAFGLDAAAPIAVISASHGTSALWVGLPKLCVVLAGGFTTNFIWCMVLSIRNGTGYQYTSAVLRDDESGNARIPLFRNYLLSALAGIVWYLQFFFYTMGETQMGEYRFSSWTIHMASIIVFSSLWGIALKEWADSSKPTKRTLLAGLAVLILSTIVVGYGNYLGVNR
jgi:L-rhamnose-H+ transport protein